MTLALARKYRPKTIDDLVGQTAMKNILQGAFDNDRIAQSYVLAGIRGVGKTTTARVIARAINCAQGPTLTPCGVCDSCRAIDSESSMDIIEMDAASNTGVDNMRDIISSVAYAPMQAGGRKIYIFDEAHMLSKNAWNALLKTLEEPPAHVMFIFATTEPKAIPITVNSRSQILPLSRISLTDIQNRLAWITQQENATIEDDALRLIARAAEGSMRDAISLLDRATTLEPNHVTTQSVLAMLGRAGRIAVANMVAHIIAGDVPKVLHDYNAFLQEGRDPMMLLEDTIEWIHQSQMARVSPAYIAHLQLPEAEASMLGTLSQATKPGALQGCAHYLLEAYNTVRALPSPSLGVEMALVRATSKFASLLAKT